QLIKLVRDTIRTDIYTQLSTTSERLSYLRSLAINNLITDCISIFMENEEAILNGTFPHALTDKSTYKAQIDDILAITIDKVYNNEEVIQKEVAGYKILQDILDAAVNASINSLNNAEDSYDKLILKSCKGLRLSGTTDYERILDVCGYVASLTDSKSIALFNIINGKI
ncbi:MAG: dGTPase, partial [Nonlabens ulvanivorans]